MVETSAAAAAPGQAPAAATPLGTLTTSFGFIPGEQIPIKAKSGSLDVRWALIEVEVVPPAEKTGKPAQALRVTLSVANPTGNDVKVAARAIFNDKKGHPLATVEGTDLCEEEDEDELTFRGNFDKALKLIKTVTLEVRSDPATAED